MESDKEFPGCDGVITNQRGTALGVYVADCCAVYIVDPKTPAIGLVHSGRKGTELGVVPSAITQMVERFGSDPANMIVQLSPFASVKARSSSNKSFSLPPAVA